MLTFRTPVFEMPEFPKRKLGKNGPLVSAIGFGAMGMSEFYVDPNAADEAEHIKVLNAAIDNGCTFWDTADMYGPFKNEVLLGKVLATRRKEVFLCTKFGIVRKDGGRSICGKPEYVKQACDDSLKRLGIECIDLYYQHRPDPTVPIEETVKAMSELVKQGKVKYIGLSECTAEQIRKAHAVHPITAYQVEYSPWFRDIERDGRLATCRELGIGIVAYSPLGRGFLTGAIRSIKDLKPGDYRLNSPKFKPEVFEKNFEIVNQLEKFAKNKGCSASQLALAWCLSKGEDIVPIPGTKRLKYLLENLGSIKVVLTATEKEQLEEIINAIPIEGAQY